MPTLPAIKQLLTTFSAFLYFELLTVGRLIMMARDTSHLCARPLGIITSRVSSSHNKWPCGKAKWLYIGMINSNTNTPNKYSKIIYYDQETDNLSFFILLRHSFCDTPKALNIRYVSYNWGPERINTRIGLSKNVGLLFFTLCEPIV